MCLKKKVRPGKGSYSLKKPDRRRLGYKDVAQVQPAVSSSSVFTGDFIGHHVRFIGHFDFPAPVSTGGSEGVSPFHLRGHTRSYLGRPAARLRGALRAVPHPSFKLCGRVSSPQLFFNRGLQRRAGHRQVFSLHVMQLFYHLLIIIG